MEVFLDIMTNLFRGVEFNVVEDENDPESCIVYVNDDEIVEDEADCLQIIDLASEILGYHNVTVSYSDSEDLYM